jgi:hypothetical protein|tara:strand:- start:200 stop:502 length:303 start_codon:yes stop_codon:yes gene_type:complete
MIKAGITDIGFENQLALFHGAALNARDIFIKRYKSPYKEQSIFKSIPIKYLDTFKLLFGKGYLIKYRGTSKLDIGYIRPQEHCHKEYADTFAVYRKKGRS